MAERTLKEYFENKLTAEQLACDLKDSQKQTSHDVIAVYVQPMPDGEFEIKIEHLVRLCDDLISGKISPADLNTVAFALETSDFFHWDNDTQVGERIADVIFDAKRNKIRAASVTMNNQHFLLPQQGSLCLKMQPAITLKNEFVTLQGCIKVL